MAHLTAALWEQRFQEEFEFPMKLHKGVWKRKLRKRLCLSDMPEGEEFSSVIVVERLWLALLAPLALEGKPGNSILAHPFQSLPETWRDSSKLFWAARPKEEGRAATIRSDPKLHQFPGGIYCHRKQLQLPSFKAWHSLYS